MCTSQKYRIIDLRRAERGRDRQQSFIYSDKNRDVADVYPFPRYLAQQIPCRNCWECKVQKAKEWAFRGMKEAKEYEDNIMMTLTYDDEHVQKTTYIDYDTGEIKEALTLRVKDHQDFMKRLRKHFGKGIKSMIAGEYGSNEEYIDFRGNRRIATERPHYHIICFNLKVDDLKFFKMKKCEWSSEKNALYTSKTISKIWGMGDVQLNEVNYETSAYVARYTTKKLYGDEAVEKYDERGRQVPYLATSRRPGLGYKFFQEHKQEYIEGKTFYIKSKKGLQEINKLEYFDKLLEKEDPEAMAKIKDRRMQQAIENWKAISEKIDIPKHQYIANREYANNQKFRKLTRRLG